MSIKTNNTKLTDKEIVRKIQTAAVKYNAVKAENNDLKENIEEEQSNNKKLRGLAIGLGIFGALATAAAVAAPLIVLANQSTPTPTPIGSYKINKTTDEGIESVSFEVDGKTVDTAQPGQIVKVIVKEKEDYAITSLTYNGIEIREAKTFTMPIVRSSSGKATTADYTTFKYFTTDSNILLLIGSCISSIYILLLWTGKIKIVPKWIWIFKQTATLTVFLTMFVTVFFLTPGAFLTKLYPPASLYMGSNLFFHLINPLVAVIVFLLFENRNDIKIKHTFWSLIPVGIYCIFYLATAYTHVGKDGTIPMDYDWYKFCSFGIGGSIGIIILLFGIYYFGSWLLWFTSKKISIKQRKGYII